MTYDIRWTSSAAQRLAEIIDYLLPRSPESIRTFSVDLADALDVVASHPDAHPMLSNVLDDPVAEGLRHAKAMGHKIVI